MALRLKNRVKETTVTTGTGSVLLAGAASGFQSFASALADGDTTYYQITDGTDWEIGEGTWDEANNELARTSVFESSNSGSKVNWGEGTKDVFIVMPAQKVHNTDVYAQISDMPLTGNSAGDQAYVTSNNNLYIWDGNGWYKIAAVNQTPTVSGNDATYALATDGTATVVTLTGTDPEGFPLTWSATTSGDTSAATVTNVDNVFTITPSTNEADVGTISVTFSASDGVNIGTASSDFTLQFGPDWTASTQQAKLLASDAEIDDNFGWSVAISGDTAIVGAHNEDTGTLDAGSVYIFTRSGSSWTQQQKIQASDRGQYDRFATGVAIDGDTLISGAQYEDPGGINGAGSAYIFTRSGSTWTQQAKLVASDAQSSDYFGTAVGISGDTAIVGAWAEDTGASGTGSAYIYTRSGSTWTQQAKIQASDKEIGDYFGWSVAISGDTVICGARDEDAGGSNAGAAYVFTRSGSTWTQQAKLLASDAEAGDWFGYSVAISGDTAVVGARDEATGGADAGAAYVFTRDGSTWTEQAKIVASDPDVGDWFGYSVAIDGDTVIVGSQLEDTGSGNAGAAYIFTRDGSTWTQQAKVQAADNADGGQLGFSVAVSGDTVIAGVPYKDTGASNAGAAYIFVAG